MMEQAGLKSPAMFPAAGTVENKEFSRSESSSSRNKSRKPDRQVYVPKHRRSDVSGGVEDEIADEILPTSESERVLPLPDESTPDLATTACCKSLERGIDEGKRQEDTGEEMKAKDRTKRHSKDKSKSKEERSSSKHKDNNKEERSSSKHKKSSKREPGSVVSEAEGSERKRKSKTSPRKKADELLASIGSVESESLHISGDGADKDLKTDQATVDIYTDNIDSAMISNDSVTDIVLNPPQDFSDAEVKSEVNRVSEVVMDKIEVEGEQNSQYKPLGQILDSNFCIYDLSNKDECVSEAAVNEGISINVSNSPDVDQNSLSVKAMADVNERWENCSPSTEKFKEMAVHIESMTDSSAANEKPMQETVEKKEVLIQTPCEQNHLVQAPCDPQKELLETPCEEKQLLQIPCVHQPAASVEVQSMDSRTAAAAADIDSSSIADNLRALRQSSSSVVAVNPAVAAAVNKESSTGESNIIKSGSDKCDNVDDDDSWETRFDDKGEDLTQQLMDELTCAVGNVQVDKPQFDYYSYQPKDPDLTDADYGHLIEIYDFPASLVTGDLLMAFHAYQAKGFDIKWVDDTHAIGIFSGPIAASSALQGFFNPLMKIRPVTQASRQTKVKVKRCNEFLLPYKARPETTSCVARNLVAGALGLQSRVSREKRAEERQKLKDAKLKKTTALKQREAAWEGTIGHCAMDTE